MTASNKKPLPGQWRRRRPSLSPSPSVVVDVTHTENTAAGEWRRALGQRVETLPARHVELLFNVSL